MKIINHECYVSPEVAKLLKKVGFDWSSFTYYDINNVLCLSDVLITKESSDLTEHINCLAPTLEVVQRWLREVNNVSVEVKTLRWVNRYQDGKYTVSYIHELWSIDTSIIPNKEDKFNRYTTDCVYNTEYQTYEEALEAGINKALEIILDGGE